MQRVGREDTMKEQKLNFSSAARFASAITLHSGKILVTGGLNRGKEVHLVNGPGYNYSWTQRKEMLYPRAGHAIAKLDIDEEECVIVAGGYDLNRKFHTSVEYYMVNKDTWIRLPYNLPYPRAFFLLQVTTCDICICHQTVFQANEWRITAFGGFYFMDGEPVYPGVATMDRTPEKEWEEWRQEEERDDNQRSSFMHAEVPLSWIQCICA